LQYSSNVLPRLADLAAQGEVELQRAPVNPHEGMSTLEARAIIAKQCGKCQSWISTNPEPLRLHLMNGFILRDENITCPLSVVPALILIIPSIYQTITSGQRRYTDSMQIPTRCGFSGRGPAALAKRIPITHRFVDQIVRVNEYFLTHSGWIRKNNGAHVLNYKV